MTLKAPLKALDILSIFQYAAGIAIEEAMIDGLLTLETADRISKRADEIKNALAEGKIVEIHKGGMAVIRDAEPDEEAELDPEKFPRHAKSKTNLDI
jgi:hypothetical protein